MLHSYNSGYSCSFYSDIMCLEHSHKRYPLGAAEARDLRYGWMHTKSA